MLTYDEQNAIIQLSDAANRAMDSGSHVLAEKLAAEAEKLLRSGTGPSFEEWCTARKYNVERFEGEYISKMTQELHDLWVTAGGTPVK